MARRQSLVCKHLENISGKMLEEHQARIREYVRGCHGVYALYKRDRLYYVGLASNLRNRLGHHLRDKHKGKWDRFSVYLTEGDGHLKELESLVLRIVRPTGNSQLGKFAKSENLKKRLRRELVEWHREQRNSLLGSGPRRRPLPRRVVRRSIGKAPPSLAGILAGPCTIKAMYKGDRYTARVRRDGAIRFDGELYKSPSGAARAITGRPTNGWWLWQFERSPGKWARLLELQR